MTKPRPFGQYFILEKIAQGGMAEIFKGLTYDFSGLKKFIVIKRILPHIAANKDFIRMLIDEAKIAVGLSHGNIAQTYDLGKVADDYFIVMEFVEGRTISQIFKKSVELKENLPIPMAVYFIAELSNGLDYIHRRVDEQGRSLEIVHRDISPQNVIVSYSGNVKIVDFGVAKAAWKLSEMESGVLKGKFAYMSPEQTEGKPIDHCSDLFSTGVVLWEILTGRRLFKKKSNAETIEAVQNMAIYPPSAYRNEIPSDLDEIVMKVLDRKPERRYPFAADLALALTKFNLKHYPEFKPAQINEYLNRIFLDEDRTGDLYQEKTMREDLTVKEAGLETIDFEDGATAVDDTMIVDPQELDFHSIFDDIDVEEVSDVTRSIALKSEVAAIGPAEEESTGDYAPDFLEDLPEPSPTQPASSEDEDSRRLRMIVAGSILLALVLLLVVSFLPSRGKEVKPVVAPPAMPAVVPETKLVGIEENAPKDSTVSQGSLEVETSPSGAKVSLGGKTVGKTPLRSLSVEANRDLELEISLKGFQSYRTTLNILPGEKEKIYHALRQQPSR